MSVQRVDVHSNGQETGMQVEVRPYYVKLVTPTFLTMAIDFTSLVFIVLIHPIQWTIALPVGATRTAKRQKKTSYIEYLQDRSGECICQVAHCTSSSCLDSVTS